jgi:TP901 family phage tail tape measure protein
MAGRKEYEMLFKLTASLSNEFRSTLTSATNSLTAVQETMKKLNSEAGKINSFKQQQESLQKSQDKLSRYNSELETLNNKYSVGEQWTERDIAAKGRLERIIANTTERVGSLSRGLERLDEELRASGVNTDNLSQANEELTRTLERLATAQNNYLNAASAQSKNSEALAKSAGATVKSVGVMAAAGAAAYGLAVKPAAEFEAAMKSVQATMNFNDTDMVDGKLGAEVMQELTNKAKEMGIATKFSASESAAAFNYMAMAGWKSGDMIDGIGGVMNLAAASGEDLAMVSDMVTDNLTAFGKQAGNAGQFADVLAAASSNANTNVAMLGESFKSVAPTAGAMGFSIEDTTLALGLMANAGIKGGEAGTKLSAGLVNLVKPTAQMSAVMKSYGISLQANAEDVEKLEKQLLAQALTEKRAVDPKAKLTAAEEKAIHVNALSAAQNLTLKGTMDKLREQMGSMSEAEQAAATAAIFGKESMSGWLSIVNAAPADYEKLSSAINNSAGAAEQIAAIKLDNFEGQMTLLKSAGEGLQISLGELLIPKVTDLAKSAAEATSKFTTWVGENKEAVETAAKLAAGIMIAVTAFNLIKTTVLAVKGVILGVKTAIAAYQLVQTEITAGTGAFAAAASVATGAQTAQEATTIGATAALIANRAALVASTIATKAAAAGQWLLNAAMTANPIGLVIAGIAALIAVIVLVVKNFDKVKEIAGKVGEGIKNVFGAAANWFKAVFSAVVEWFNSNVIQPVVRVFQPIIQKITEIFSTIWQIIVALFKFAAQWFNDTVIQPVTSVFSTVVGAVSNFFTETWNKIVAVFTAAAQWFNDNVIQPTISFFAPIVAAIGGFFTEAWNRITAVFSVATEWFRTKFSEAWEAVKSVFSAVGEFFQGIWNSITGIFTNVGTAIGDAVSGAFKSVVNTILSFAENKINGFINGINKVVGFVNNIPGVSIKAITPLTIPKLATGSNYSPDTFIAGDAPSGKRGGYPELITNASGRKVFTAAQTANIFQNIKAARQITEHRKAPQLELSREVVHGGSRSGNAPMTVTFSPNITVSGGNATNGKDIAEQIQAALEKAMPGFIAQIENSQRDRHENEVRMAYA